MGILSSVKKMKMTSPKMRMGMVESPYGEEESDEDEGEVSPSLVKKLKKVKRVVLSLVKVKRLKKKLKRLRF